MSGECDTCNEHALECICQRNNRVEIIKCLQCGHILISGKGMQYLFGSGTSIQCMKCGNKYCFGNDSTKKLEIK